MRGVARRVLSAVAALVCTVTLFGQSAASSKTESEAKPLTYELVSIHLSKPDAQGYDLNSTPDGMDARAITLWDLVSEAYGFTFGDLLDGQIANLPEWGGRRSLISTRR